MLDQLEFEIGGVEELKSGVQESGGMEEAVRDAGRFGKSHPRDFPMGVGDLYDPDRPRKVSVAEVV